MNRGCEAERFDAALLWIVRKLRLWIDAADEHVHELEVKLRKGSVTAATASPGKVGQSIESAEAKLGESCDRNKKALSAELSQPRSRVGNPAGHGRFNRKISAREFDSRFESRFKTERLRELANDFEVAWSGR